MLTQLSLKNYQLTIVAFIMIAALGVNSFLNMPRSEDPPLTAAYFYVIAVYPGASPKDLEQLVIDPMEETLNELEDIKKITSKMQDGLAVLNIEFNAGVDGDRKYDEVNRQINIIRNKLPTEISSLEVGRWSTTNVNILQYALVSNDATYKDLEKQAKDLKKEIEKNPFVKKTEISACPEQNIRIGADLEKLAQKHISVNELIASIEGGNSNIPGGDLDVGHCKFNIKTSGSYKSLEDIRRTTVHSGDNNVVYLQDVATVDFDYQQSTHIGRFNGQKAIFITASQKEGTNIFNVAKDINQRAIEFGSHLPAHIQLVKAFDQSINVNERLNHLYTDFGIAIFLILLTLLPLGTRASLIVMIAIPSSLLIGLIMLYLTGFSINQLSIVGLVISLGLLVDDSIVVVENIVRYMRNGLGRKEAVLKATAQISRAVIGCTATMVVSFFPLMVLPGGPGTFIRSLPVAVVFTLLASLLVSFTLTPFLASRILKEKTYVKENIFLRLLNRINNGPYQKLLIAGLRYPKFTLGISALAVAFSLMLLPVVGFSLFPKAEKPQFFINLETAPGTSLMYTDSITRKIESILNQKSEIKSYCTNVGKGNPMVYYNLMQANEKPNFAQFFIQLKRYDQHKTPVFLENLRKELEVFPGSKIEIKEFTNGTAEEAPIEIAFFGNNLDTLKRLASMGEAILKGTRGTTYVRNPLQSSVSDITIRINKDKAGMLLVPIISIETAVRMAIAGLNIGKFTDEDGKDYTLLFTIKNKDAKSMEDLDKIYVESAKGIQIPLKNLASITFNRSMNLIEHYHKERSITIRANVLPGYLTDKVTKQILAELNRKKLPEGYYYRPFGEISSREETFGNMNTAIILTLFVVLLILIVEFRTVKGSLIVASSIPLGIIGSVVLLYLTGYSFSFTAFVGMISLIGIEVKNAIILVDYINHLRKEGHTLEESIQTAGKIRFIPIILTTLTAIGGLLPLALEGSELFTPLSLTIIGGLISSTLFTRVVTPVLCKLLLR